MPIGERNRSKTHCPAGHAYDEANTYWQKKGLKGFQRSCRRCQADRSYRKRREQGLDVHAQRMREWRAANPDRNRRNWRENRLQKKAWLDEQKVACQQCGMTHIACLEFHHRDPQEKDFLISLAIARHSLDRIKAEVSKCDVLCSNCHRILHWEQRQRRD